MTPGYRFYPTEEELVGFYLWNKLRNNREDMDQVIPVAEVYCFDPWELPPMSGVACREDGEQWFFFCPRQEREAQGGRPTRTTPSGYWKATGSPSLVFSSMNRAIGVKKTMVFYSGRAPSGAKSKWKMNEYRIFDADDTGAGASTSLTVGSKTRREFSLCRVYTRSGCIRSFDRRPLDLDAPANDDAGSSFTTPPPPPPAVVTCKRTRTEDGSSSSAGSGGDDTTSWRSVRQRGDDDHNSNYQLTATEEDDYLNLLLENWL